MVSKTSAVMPILPSSSTASIKDLSGITPAPHSNLKINTTVVKKGIELHRVHPAAYGATSFNDSPLSNARFSTIHDAAGAVAPTMYAGTTHDCALMVTLLELLINFFIMSKAPCIPPDLNAIDLNWRRITPILGQANAALGRYDGLLRSLPNAAVLLSPITTNEAVLSSRIEGTQVTLEEVLQQDGGIDAAPERQADMIEVRNYRSALFGAQASMAHRPISLSLITEVHQALMQGVRGQDKTPGEFRNDQNWIGRAGSSMEDARFIPPNPMVLPQALEAWESYIGNSEEDPVLQIAVVHAQFEILHPFKDGNGRIGRMLIPLVLYQRGLLSRPMFYLSEYLESNRSEYYDRLLAITENNDWQGWVEFFTQGVLTQADLNLSKAHKMHALYNELKDKFMVATKSQYAVPALDAFFKKPILNSTDFASRSGIGNRVTANSILKTLTDLSLIQILRPGAGRNPHIYVLGELVNIAEGRDVVAVRSSGLTQRN